MSTNCISCFIKHSIAFREKKATNTMKNTIFVTGGAGFIGSALIRLLIKESNYTIVNIDKLTYAGNLMNLSEVAKNERYIFSNTDICDKEAINNLFNIYRPLGVIHLAAESHVDRSIANSNEFIATNIIGTHILLEASRVYFNSLSKDEKNSFRFHHVSTDEVFGSLGENGYFDETTSYDPRSPYSASKASSDHLVRAWSHTYGLPTIISNCSNNYGPYHFPEKLIPLMILNILESKNLPIYGDGSNIRDWLFVDDHAMALKRIFEDGKIGETYCIGGHNEKTNMEVVNALCDSIDSIFAQRPSLAIQYPKCPASQGASSKTLIKFVADRPGHDRRYAIDASKLKRELGWEPKETFESGIKKTVEWYLDNMQWVNSVVSGEYKNWIEQNYTSRDFT